jgi:hypothetical protein
VISRLSLLEDAASIALFVSVAIGVLGCGSDADSQRRPAGVGAASSSSSPLSVLESRTPPLRVPDYRTSGTFPQVASRTVDVTHINFALRKAVLDEQHQYARIALQAERRIPKLVRRRYPGVFKTLTQSTLISASTNIVSVLLPVLELFPAGNNGSTWLSITLRVPSASRVEIRDLFSNPIDGLKFLAYATRQRLGLTNPCFRKSLHDPIAAVGFSKGLRPTAANYRHFVLTTSGLTIGFPIGQVADTACGRIQATVPYADLRPHISQAGETLIAGVRRPRR